MSRQFPFRPASFLLCAVFSFLTEETTSSESFFTSAVFEHSRITAVDGSAKNNIEANLVVYRRATNIARAKGADIILFPEYGIFQPGDRDKLKDYLETIPDPQKFQVNPCAEPQQYSKRPILLALSCMAKENSIVVVANTGDSQACPGEPNCPSDGVFQFNTNVVFDRNGTLLLKYHKEHLFYEFGMDVPVTQQKMVFETDFGKFATFISFDIAFERATRISMRSSVDAVLFSAMWVDYAPQMTSVQLWQSWAMGNDVSLLAANIQIPGHFAVGSGIFHRREGALAYTHNPDGLSKLMVARLPKRHHPSVAPRSSVTAVTREDSWEWRNEGKDIPLECSRQLLNDTTRIYYEYRCIDENINNYTLVRLTRPSGRVEACNNGMCCSLDYSANKLSETFYLGVYNGSHEFFGRYSWWEENCILVRCEAVGNSPCATFPRLSKTRFHLVQLQGNFTTPFVYPSVVSSGVRLTSREDWKYQSLFRNDKKINFKSQVGRNLIIASLKGRCYSKDPPYKR